MRKRGDIEGAITCFKAAPEQQRRLPAAWAAMGWVFYDRDIKPIAPAAQKADPTLRLTDKMVSDALESTGKIKVWCKHDLYSKFSAYPTAYLAVAKLLRDQERHGELRALLESETPIEFSKEKGGDYPSHREQWVALALDATKQILSADNLTPTRALVAKPLLEILAGLDQARGISADAVQIETRGQKRTLPSHKQRFILQYTRFLQETGDLETLAKVCRRTIEAKDFDRNPNLKWILYRYAQALKETNPNEALKVCNEFVALEYKSYSILLRAEIHLACGNTELALKEAAHSLQIIGERDLPFITKNLTFLANLLEDREERKMHIQMVRSIRSEQNHPPSPALEAQAAELGLPPASEAPNADILRAIWDKINPQPSRPRPTGAPKNQKKQTGEVPLATKVHRNELKRFDTTTTRFGDIIFAASPAKDGPAKPRPMVIVGETPNELIVGLLFSNSNNPHAVTIEHWQEANLRMPNSFVASLHTVKNSHHRTLGKLTDVDQEKVRKTL